VVLNPELQRIQKRLKSLLNTIQGTLHLVYLEDFMNITPTAVTNAANLSLFMVNVSQVLMGNYRQEDPEFSVLDLKALYRGYRYVTETIQMLPQKPDDNLVSQLFQKVAAWGHIHPANLPVSSP